MELAVKCAALAIFSALVSLMIRRMNPEFSFALAAVTVVTLLIASASLLEKTISSFREAEKIFADTTMQMRPMLKCLGIAAASRLGADLCRDASQAALASAVELAGTLCAVAVSMPMIFTMLTTIGGLL